MNRRNRLWMTSKTTYRSDMAHIAESTHWYDRAGLPVYEVEAKKGGKRPTTLRDARLLDLVPSVTTIIGLADKPALTNWKIDQAILAALTLPRLDNEPESDWIKRVKSDSKEQARKAAERGTAIHAAIQGSFEGEYPVAEYSDHVRGAAVAVFEHFGQVPWKAEQSFADLDGFGGKVDLSVNDEREIVVDFKSKEFNSDTKLEIWDEQAMQLAAYAEGLGMSTYRAAICYVSVTVPGLAKVIEVEKDDLARGWKQFQALLAFWKAKNRYLE